MTKDFRYLERIVRGFSNHRRIQMLTVLQSTSDLDVIALARITGVNFRTASEHLGRLVRSGLVRKRSKGRQVLHTISPRGIAVLDFLRALK